MAKKIKQAFDGEHKRSVRQSIWTDPEWMMLCDTIEKKLIFLWLLLGPHTTYYGIYKFIVKQLANDTDIDNSIIEEILQHFEEGGIIVREGYWVYVRCFMEHQIQRYAERALKNLEDNKQKIPQSLISAFLADKQRYEMDSAITVGNTVPDTVAGTVPLNKKKKNKENETQINVNQTQPLNQIEIQREIEKVKEGKATITETPAVVAVPGIPSGGEPGGSQTEERDSAATLTEDNRDLIQRLAKNFCEVIGWTGNPFGDKVHHFVKTANIIQKHAGSKIPFQNNIIEFLMKALEDWAKKDSSKQISTGHLCSNYTWTNIFPQYLNSKHYGMKIEDLDDDTLN